MALAYVPRSSTPAALISLVSELSSSSESEVEQEEPIVIEALLVAAHHGDLPFIRCVRKPRSTITRADRLVAVCHMCGDRTVKAISLPLLPLREVYARVLVLSTPH